MKGLDYLTSTRHRIPEDMNLLQVVNNAFQLFDDCLKLHM